MSNKKVKEEVKTYRFGNLVLKHYPADGKKRIASYRLSTIQDDKHITWGQYTTTYKWIDHIINEHGDSKEYYTYLENCLILWFDLACEWMPTAEGLNEIASNYIEDVKRWKDAMQVGEVSEKEDQNIIEEERHNFEMSHGT